MERERGMERERAKPLMPPTPSPPSLRREGRGRLHESPPRSSKTIAAVRMGRERGIGERARPQHMLHKLHVQSQSLAPPTAWKTLAK